MHEEEHARLHSSRASLVCAPHELCPYPLRRPPRIMRCHLPRALGANVRERNVAVTKAQRRAEACNN